MQWSAPQHKKYFKKWKRRTKKFRLAISTNSMLTLNSPTSGFPMPGHFWALTFRGGFCNIEMKMTSIYSGPKSIYEYYGKVHPGRGCTCVNRRREKKKRQNESVDSCIITTRTSSVLEVFYWTTAIKKILREGFYMPPTTQLLSGNIRPQSS